VLLRWDGGSHHRLLCGEWLVKGGMESYEWMRLQAFQFVMSVWGLVISIKLMNTGANMCPAHGVDCGWLVFLFTITMIMNAFRSNKVEMPAEEDEQRPIAEWNRNTRVLVSPFVFHREYYKSPPMLSSFLNYPYFSPQRRRVPLRRAKRPATGLQRLSNWDGGLIRSSNKKCSSIDAPISTTCVTALMLLINRLFSRCFTDINTG